jgi:hypothetical protein
MPDTGEWSEGASQQHQLVSERNISRSHGLITRSAAGWRKESPTTLRVTTNDENGRMGGPT